MLTVLGLRLHRRQWQAADAQSLVTHDGDGTGCEVLLDRREVSEDQLRLVDRSSWAGPAQEEHRGLLRMLAGEEGAEVRVRGDEHALLIPSPLEYDIVESGLRP